MADSKGLDHYRRGEPFGAVQGVATTGLDHYRRGAPVVAIIPAAGTSAASNPPFARPPIHLLAR